MRNAGLLGFPPRDEIAERHPLARLARDGAATGQVPTWDGRKFAPATPAGGAVQPRPYIYMPCASITGGVMDGVARNSVSGSGAAVAVGQSTLFPDALRQVSRTWARCSKGTTATGRAQMNVGFSTGGNDGRFFLPVAGQREVWDCLFALSHLPDATDAFHAMVGFPGSDPHQVTCGGVFVFADQNSGNWIARTRVSGSGSFTDTNTGVALVVDTAFRMNIRWTTESVEFRINGTLVATHTTNLPTTASFGSFGIISTAGTAERFTYTSDLMIYTEAA